MVETILRRTIARRVQRIFHSMVPATTLNAVNVLTSVEA